MYGKKNSLLIIVDRLSFPDTVLHLDFLELFDEAKVSDGYFRGYDVDDGDMVKATLLNGHLYDNMKQFELSSSSWVSGGANMIYNDGDEEFGYTFTTKYIFLGKGKRFWCQPGKFPCNHWSIIACVKPKGKAKQRCRVSPQSCVTLDRRPSRDIGAPDTTGDSRQLGTPLS